MLQPRRRLLRPHWPTWFIPLVILAHVNCEFVDGPGAAGVRAERVGRDESGVNTVLLLDNNGRNGRYLATAVPVVTSTARTFVQEGTTTEYATHVIGTRLDKGKLYASVVGTSSRVYYDHNLPRFSIDNQILPTVPWSVRPTAHLVYPAKEPKVPFKSLKSSVVYQTAINEAPLSFNPKEDSFSKYSESEKKAQDTFVKFSNTQSSSVNRAEGKPRDVLDEDENNFLVSPHQDLFNQKRNVAEGQDSSTIKPTQVVKPGWALPTFTIKHDFAPSGFSADVEAEETTEGKSKDRLALRGGKALYRHGVKTDNRKLDTVTYRGFADFTTTVGDTVIIFMPNTAKNEQTRIIESFKASSLVHSDDFTVVSTMKTFYSHTPGMQTKTVTGHSLSMQTTLPTHVVLPESGTRKVKAFPVDDTVHVVDAVPDQTDANLKSTDSLEHVADDETTTNPFIQPSVPLLEASLSPSIQASEVLPPEVGSRTTFFTEQTEPLATFATTRTQILAAADQKQPLGLVKVLGGTRAFNDTTTLFTSLIYGTIVDGTYTQVIHSTSSVFYLVENTYVPSVTTPEPETTTESEDASTITENVPTTNLEDISTTPVQATTPEADLSYNEVERGRKIKTPPNDQVIVDNKLDADVELPKSVLSSVPNLLVPSTVYKTFTYLTTFFIPDGTSTTTSVRSREVTSSEVKFVTKTINGNVEKLSVIPVSPTSVQENLMTKAVSIGQEATAEADSFATTMQDEKTTTENSLDGGKTTVDIEVEKTTTDKISEDLFITTENIIKEEQQVTSTESEEVTITSPAPITTTPENEEEEIDLIFKTLYTTYTYLTTFFQESTTSVSSREVVVTNIVTSTLDHDFFASASDPAVAGLFGRGESLISSEIVPTSVGIGRPTTQYFSDLDTVLDESVKDTVNQEHLQSSPISLQSTSLSESIIKTFYTTYTYFTTIFVDGETSISSRTEVYTNIVTPSVMLSTPIATPIQPSRPVISQSVHFDQVEAPQIQVPVSKQYLEGDISHTRTPLLKSTPLYAYSSTISRNNLKHSLDLNSAADSQISTSLDVDDDNRIVPQQTPSLKDSYATISRSHNFNSPAEALVGTTTKSSVPSPDLTDSTIKEKQDDSVHELDLEEPNMEMKSAILAQEQGGPLLSSFKEDPVSASLQLSLPVSPLFEASTSVYDDLTAPDSSPVIQVRLDTFAAGDLIEPSSVLDEPVTVKTMSMITDITSSSSGGNLHNDLLDDQISSESNTEEIEPSPTLLLQTSYTTFTYFTTVYKGSSSSEVISRLETVTNVVTETLSPTRSTIVEEDATLPVTYFTTFTYWTTLYRDGSTVVTSREETVSNIITPSVTLPPVLITATPVVSKESSKIEPTTYYTTYTYFTTSYIGNSTVLNSRLETITNIVNETDDQTGRAIGTTAPEQLIVDQVTKAEGPNSLPTGLLSTIFTSEVKDGATTLFSTDVYGTYIDGLYAKILESSTQIVTATPSSTQSVMLQPTGVVSLNEGRIVDADGISTTYFTTKAIGTYIEQLYAQVIESTSSIKVDEEKNTLSPTENAGNKNFKTGLVRLIEGSIVKDHTTTFYESKVVGTVIDGRYAQIIESTSSFKVGMTSTTMLEPSIVATPVATLDQAATSILLPSTTPSSTVIESSIGDDGSDEEEVEDEEDEEDDDDDSDGGSKKSKKSRLRFSTRKRTFTPVIRPFASRNRPTFNPRRKTAEASSATTITRTTLTPTITATPAAKTAESRGRFASNRRQSSSLNEIRPASPSSSRRFSRVRTSPGVSAGGFSTSSSSRGRSSTRVFPTATTGVPGSSRRGGFYRGSSTRGSITDAPLKSSIGGSNSRFRIRPTSSGFGRGASTAYASSTTELSVNQEDNDITTLVTEDTPGYTDEEQDSPTQPISTTTESSRRTNPLLRFRRPPTLRAQSTSPRPATTTSARRTPTSRRVSDGNNNRLTTTSTTPRPKTTPSFSSRFKNLNNRPRPSNSLFPKRGLLKKPEEEEKQAEKVDEDLLEKDDSEEIIGDNDYEGSELEESKTDTTGRKSKSLTPQIKPFVGFQRRRFKRQTSEFGARREGTTRGNYNPRFRRPTATRTQTQVQERSDVIEEDTVTETPKGKSPSRFTPRPRTAAATQQKIRPTTASSVSGRSPFTLREKDAIPRNFRRPSPSRRRPTPTKETTTNQRAKAPRLRTNANVQAETTQFTRPSARRYSNSNTNSRRPTSRSRSRDTTNFDSYTYSPSSFDGTITITHRVPTEVTIPVVNGKVTEYRNVITASPSTEVLGPHQYTTTAGKDGSPVLLLTSEVTGTLPNGLTEVTQYILHETPTTSITFTPTVIRGRKTSFSHVIPSTVYEVEQLVSTIQPQLSPNAPLANILLSQLLLGNLNLAQPNLNPLLGINQPTALSTPTTEFKTRATTYVTTVTKGTSTVLPLTFRGKEILTTIVDTTLETITATEFITDTIVVTPTAVATANQQQLNSLLLPALLQAQLFGQNQGQSSTSNPLFALQQLQDQKNDDALDVEEITRASHRRRKPEDPDRQVRDSEKEFTDDDVGKVEDEPQLPRFKATRKKPARNQVADKKPPDPPPSPPATSVVTLYVSGRRPGEFSTVLSTVVIDEDNSAAIKKREAGFVDPGFFKLETSKLPEININFPNDQGYLENTIMFSTNDALIETSQTETQSLESIVGDVSKYILADRYTSKLDDNLMTSTTNFIKKSPMNDNKMTGHFLSKGPAEFAPLKRKVEIKSNGGLKDDMKPTSSGTLTPFKDITTVSSDSNNTSIHSRSKRSTDDSNSEDIIDTPKTSTSPQRRRRVRVRVPVDRANHDTKHEMLDMSEAQHSDKVTGMELITTHSNNNENYSEEFGLRRIKVIKSGTKDPNFDDNRDTHKKRIVVRRRKPQSQDITPIEESHPNTFESVAKIENAAQGTSSSHNVASSNAFTVTPVDLNTSSVQHHRRKVVVTKKRPIGTPSSSLAPSSSHRRRVVVTKKRPAAVKTTEIYPTESLSTVYSYMYSSIDEGGEQAQKMVKVSQVFMSGNILPEVQPKLSKKTETHDKIDLNAEKPKPKLEVSMASKSIQLDTSGISTMSTLIQPSQIESSFQEEQTIKDVPTATQALDPILLNKTLEIDANQMLMVTSVENKSISEETKDLMNFMEGELESGTTTLNNETGDHTDGESVTSSTEDGAVADDSTDYDGPPRFVRPTRFSITRKPSRAKASFLGGRRKSTQASSPSLSSTGTVSSKSYTSKTGFHSSSSKPSDRYRTGDLKPTSTYKSQQTTRGFRPHKTYGHKKEEAAVEEIKPTVKDVSEDLSINSKLESTMSPSIDSSLTGVMTPIVDSQSTTDNNTLVSPTPQISSDELSSFITRIVTHTRLRTYTYVITRVSGDEQVVTSSTEVKPHVTTVTLTQSLPDLGIQTTTARDDRVLNIAEPRFNLATKVMSNGVEVIVAGDKSTLPGEPEILRVLSATPSRPVTLAPSTLTDHMMMFLPQGASQADLSSSLHGNEFVTKTYFTTYTYLQTSIEDGTTDVSKQEHVVSNVATEERLASTPALTKYFTLASSPSLATGTFYTTYTYFNTMVDGEIPLVVTSTRTVANTVTAPPAELTQASQEETNVYLSTLDFTKTVTEGDVPQVLSTQNVLTQKVITHAASQTHVVDQPHVKGSTTDVVKTYFVTYTYLNTYLESGSTVVSSDVSISTDIVTEKFYINPKRTSNVAPTSIKENSPVFEVDKTMPLYLFATKTYLTTFTYFTTLLQEGGDHKTSTLVSSHTSVVQNIVTESISPDLFGSEAISSLRNSLQSGSVVATATLQDGHKLKVTAMEEILPTKTSMSSVTATTAPVLSPSENNDASLSASNIVTGSTIIFFDENDQIDSQSSLNQATPALDISTAQTLALQTTLLHAEGGSNQGTIDPLPLTSQNIQLDVVPQTTAGPLESLHSPALVDFTGTPHAVTPAPAGNAKPSSNVTIHSGSNPVNKRPNGGSFGPGGSEIQVSDLLSLGSLGINGLNALGPVINAMAGLIQSNIHDNTRRNDTITGVRPGLSYLDEKGNPRPVFVSQDDRTTARSPIYIPVGGLAEDVETAESVNHESWGDSQARHPNLGSNQLGRQPLESPLLSDGIAISPGQVITANSDVIVGKPGLLGPRPPKIHSEKEIPVGMRPPPLPRPKRPATEPYLGPPPIPDQVGHQSVKDHVGGPPPQRIRDHLSSHQPNRNHNGHNGGQGGKHRDYIGGRPPVRNHQSNSPNKNYFLGRLPSSNDHRVDADLHPPPLPIGNLGSFHTPQQQVGADIIVHPPILNENHFISSNPNSQEIGQFPVSSGVQAVFGQQQPNDIIHGKMPTGSHVLDSSGGEPLLVNIQPSQVANVVIKDGSSTAYPFEGADYVDRSPFPVPENGPSFVGFDSINGGNIHHHGYSGSSGSSHQTRMDPPPLNEAESVNINVAPQGINVDIIPGQGINVDVSPGHGLNVEVSGHVHGNEHISPSGIVLDAPLNERPSPNEIPLLGRPNDNSYGRPGISHGNNQDSRRPHRPTQGNGGSGQRIPIPHHHFPHNQGSSHNTLGSNQVLIHNPHGQSQTPNQLFHNGNQGPNHNSHGQSQPPNQLFHNSNQGPNHNTHGQSQPPNKIFQNGNQGPNHNSHGQSPPPNKIFHNGNQGPNHNSHGHAQTPNKVFHNNNEGSSHSSHGPSQTPNHVSYGSNQKPNYIPHGPTQATNHISHNKNPASNHGSHGESYPQRPIDFMIPPPPPSQKHFTKEPVIIPLHSDGLQEDNDSEDSYESEDGELTQASNSRPLRPGQLPSEIENSASRRPSTRPSGNSEVPEIFLKTPQLPISNINVHQLFDNRPSKPENTPSSFDVMVQPQGNFGKPQIFDETQKLPSKVWPKLPQFDGGHEASKEGSSVPQGRPQHINVEEAPQKPSVHLKRPVGLFDKPAVPLVFDLEPQGNTPRPLVTRPTPPKQIAPNQNSVLGLSPPPKPQNFPQGPTINIGGQRRPAAGSYKNKTRPVSPYKFEIPPTTTSSPAQEILTLSETNIKQNQKPSDDRFSYGVVEQPPPVHVEKIRATTTRPAQIYRPKTVRPILASILSHEMNLSKQQSSTQAVKHSIARPQPTSVVPVLQTVVVGKPILSNPPATPSLPRVPIRPSLNSQWDGTIIGSETVYLDHVSHPTPIINIVTKPETITKATIGTTAKTVHGSQFPRITSTYKPTRLPAVTTTQTQKRLESVQHSKVQPEVAYSKTTKPPAELPTRYITHTKTLTVTTTETTVISSEGHKPSTRTVVLTKTQTSTIIDTVTQTHTLVKPTEVVATVTTTVSAAHYPVGSPFDPANYPQFPTKMKPTDSQDELNVVVTKEVDAKPKEEVKKTVPQRKPEENDTFFVVVNDKKLSSVSVSTSNKNVVKEEEIASRDEADSNDEVNRAVLLGGVLVAAPPPRHGVPSSSSPTACRPDCSPARNELCQKVEGHMRCVCRPGFARMFPDRPCKPTYTYTLRLGLERRGKEPLKFETSLGDRATPAFRHLAQATREGLDRLVMQSDLRDIYHGVAVDSFQPTGTKPNAPPLLVSFYVQLSDNVDETRLKEVFKKSLRTSNMSLGGTDVFADKESLQHLVAEDFDECTSSQFHDCSEHSRCFNLRGTYTCSCQEGYADLSENPLFPGRVCSAEVIGCDKCHYHGTCYTRDEQLVCQCFQWYSGETCHVNLKVLLIALVTIGTLLLGLLLVCAVLTCTKRNRARRPGNAAPGFLRYRGPSSTLDKRAMIADSSSEGSIDNGPVTFLAPTHQAGSGMGSAMKGGRRVESVGYGEQRDRSLTVMIPRAKYRPVPPTSPHLTMSTFGVDEHRRASGQEQKLLGYLEHGAQLAFQPTEQAQNMTSRENISANPRRKQSNITNDSGGENAVRKASPVQQTAPGALVSAGFQVSATVGRKEESEEEILAPVPNTHFPVTRTTERTVSEARSCDETTIQLPTKSFHGPSQYGSKPSSRNRDEAHTMAERDLGSTLLMPQTHLYRPDRGSDISNFDSL